MSAVTEQNIRAAFAERAAIASTDATKRLRAIEYRPRDRRSPSLPMIGVGLAIATVLAVLLVLLTASSSSVVRPPASTTGAPNGPETSIALTSWTALPTKPTPIQLAKATKACNWIHSWNGPAVMRGQPVLAEQRNAITAAIYVNKPTNDVYICMSSGRRGDTLLTSASLHFAGFSRPGVSQLGYPDNAGGSLKGFTGKPLVGDELGRHVLPIRSVRRGNRIIRMQPISAVRIAAGLAGKNVTAISFTFSHHVTVKATIQNGWYFAWWPGHALPWHAKVATSNGATVTSPMPWSNDCRDRAAHKCGAFIY
jgi:hypothetical protein